jgi:hypothetical protein
MHEIHPPSFLESTGASRESSRASGTATADRRGCPRGYPSVKSKSRDLEVLGSCRGARLESTGCERTSRTATGSSILGHPKIGRSSAGELWARATEPDPLRSIAASRQLTTSNSTRYSKSPALPASPRLPSASADEKTSSFARVSLSRYARWRSRLARSSGPQPIESRIRAS